MEGCIARWVSGSHPTRVRGLKPGIQKVESGFVTSHPTRVRGLKLPEKYTRTGRKLVAPHAGAWIETGTLAAQIERAEVAPHAGAWIETCPPLKREDMMKLSHPTRVRGLKPRMKASAESSAGSHPTRVRGLKLEWR